MTMMMTKITMMPTILIRTSTEMTMKSMTTYDENEDEDNDGNNVDGE